MAQLQMGCGNLAIGKWLAKKGSAPVHSYVFEYRPERPITFGIPAKVSPFKVKYAFHVFDFMVLNAAAGRSHQDHLNEKIPATTVLYTGT